MTAWLQQDYEFTGGRDADQVTASPLALRADVIALYAAWWDKRPPETTPAERVAAALARNRARRGGWCPGMGLDDDGLEDPGYQPQCTWRPATGTGVAGDDPLGKGRRTQT